MPHSLHSIVIHGHFYQPPREDPWVEEIETEATAAPYHDWNERIERESYRTVVAAHLTKGDRDNRIVGVVNTLAWISFNFGATLLEWLEEHAPKTYRAILDADKASTARLGYGNAIAQPYHHVILPLASRRDKLTEVRWGIADFRRRFGREPLGMWLPETAMDHETLDVLAECGIRFTILAPHQVEKPPPNGLPGEYRAANGKSVALFMYDGDLSHGVAFGALLSNATEWAARMLRTHARLTSIATDGETYGHHHKFSEMALARVITELRARRGVVVENFASFLSKHPPVHKVKLVEPTSWSCAHGVERWRANCGCRVNGEKYPSQEWRTPLRGGFDALAAGLHALFEREGSEHFADPWAARDAYGETMGVAAERAEVIVSNLAPRSANIVRARELLEMERDALRMYSSCAWFFDDIGGLEPRQAMRYAAHAAELADSNVRGDLEQALVELLGRAKSNDAAVGTGRDVYVRRVARRVNADLRTAAGVAAVHALGLNVHAAVPRAYQLIAMDGAALTLRRARTGRTVSVESDTSAVALDSADIVVRVRVTPDGLFQPVPLSEFPERARVVIRASLRQRLLGSTLTGAELAALANGDATLRDLAARALVRAIEALTGPDPDTTLRHANSVLDLLEQLESPVPFDAQAAWWNVHSQGGNGARAAQLAALGRRLGFDTPIAS
jgi:alpha-amylase/alpha-mannosidase (GH57 family)